MVDETDDVVIEAVHVIERHGLVEHPKLAQYESLEELIHGAQSPRHGDEAVGHVLQQLLALGHRIHHDELVDVVVTDFHVHEMAGDGAGDLALPFHHHVGDDLHQPHAATAIKQLAVAVGHGLTELGSLFAIHGIKPHAAAAKNTDLLHRKVIFCKCSFFM